MANTEPQRGPGSTGEQVAGVEPQKANQDEKNTVMMAKAMSSTNDIGSGPPNTGEQKA